LATTAKRNSEFAETMQVVKCKNMILHKELLEDKNTRQDKIMKSL
jgi:hypothetical protein